MPYLNTEQREQCAQLWDALTASSPLNQPRALQRVRTLADEARTAPSTPTTTGTQSTELEALEGARIDWSNVKAFMLAGNATFTLRSTKTGKRYTYKVRVSKPDHEQRWTNSTEQVWFVSLLTGPDNGQDYRYVGMIRNQAEPQFVLTRKSTYKSDALPVVAIEWVIRALRTGNPNLAKVEVWHMGKCGRCGRALTVPESIAIGLGPDCATKGF